MKTHLLGAGALLLSMAAALGEPPATNTPPGPAVLPDATNAEPETPADPQETAKSAPGAASPNGANGTTISGKPVTKSPNTPPEKANNPNPAAASAGAAVTATAPAAKNSPLSPAAQQAGSVLDHYLQDLTDTLQLTADEKKDIQTYYLEDGPSLQTILNNASISPLQQAQQVSDLRDKRDDKIGALLADPDRRREFFKVEATYRVALTQAAGDGAMCPAQPPPPVPAPTDITPGQAEPIPTKNDGGL